MVSVFFPTKLFDQKFNALKVFFFFFKEIDARFCLRYFQSEIARVISYEHEKSRSCRIHTDRTGNRPVDGSMKMSYGDRRLWVSRGLLPRPLLPRHSTEILQMLACTYAVIPSSLTLYTFVRSVWVMSLSTDTRPPPPPPSPLPSEMDYGDRIGHTFSEK